MDPKSSHFSQILREWYSTHKRDLPWREEKIDPYFVVVSEFMLQQTQAPRVVEKYQEFIQLFPTIEVLAAASPAMVIKAWSGLGYNRRALLLQRFTQEVCTKYKGVIPSAREELIQLPGIGPYSAGSIASFAFNLPEPAIDVNVRRIFCRIFSGRDQGAPQGRAAEEALHALLRETIPTGGSRDFHNALMDFGSLVCTRDSPHCSSCPVQTLCAFSSLYQVKGKGALFVREKKVEKGVLENGRFVPHRLFRGRIIEFVRKNEHCPLQLSDFGKAIKKDFDLSEKDWLLSLCEKLSAEGLVLFMLHDEVISLSFPGGS